MKRGKRREGMTAGEFALVYRWLLPEYRRELLSAPLPKTLCGKRVPESLDGLTLGQLEELMLADNRPLGEQLAVICRVVLGAEDARAVAEAPASGICALARWVAEESERIGRAFAALVLPRTPEEDAAARAAGVDRPEKDFFSLADWYARRMGITDHAEAMRVPWKRIYECRRIDFLTAKYERRLAEERTRRMRMKRKAPK